METLTVAQVNEIRARFAQARELASERFRQAFAEQAQLPPNERWRVHLEIQAASMLDLLTGVSLAPGLRIIYMFEGNIIHPVIDGHRDIFRYFRIEKTVAALFEYWIFTSELMSSAGWNVTRVIATSEEYNEALARMEQVQLVRPLFVQYLPAGEFREDGTAVLEVTLYTRATEERIERRELLLDHNQELHFHSRDLIAEGRGGVPVS